jgi:PleD family two-component response regulator
MGAAVSITCIPHARTFFSTSFPENWKAPSRLRSTRVELKGREPGPITGTPSPVHPAFISPALSSRKAMRILLVEDEPDAARVLAKGLREQAYAVDVVGDGEAACFQAETSDYDAIVLDLLLPGRDGLSVCRQLRRGGAPVPILMLTARD